MLIGLGILLGEACSNPVAFHPDDSFVLTGKSQSKEPDSAVEVVGGVALEIAHRELDQIHQQVPVRLKEASRIKGDAVLENLVDDRCGGEAPDCRGDRNPTVATGGKSRFLRICGGKLLGKGRKKAFERRCENRARVHRYVLIRVSSEKPDRGEPLCVGTKMHLGPQAVTPETSGRHRKRVFQLQPGDPAQGLPGGLGLQDELSFVFNVLQVTSATVLEIGARRIATARTRLENFENHSASKVLFLLDDLNPENVTRCRSGDKNGESFMAEESVTAVHQLEDRAFKLDLVGKMVDTYGARSSFEY